MVQYLIIEVQNRADGNIYENKHLTTAYVPEE